MQIPAPERLLRMLNGMGFSVIKRRAVCAGRDQGHCAAALEPLIPWETNTITSSGERIWQIDREINAEISLETVRYLLGRDPDGLRQDGIFNNMIFLSRKRWILAHNYIEQHAQLIKIPPFPWISSNMHSLSTDSRNYTLQNYQDFFFPSILISFFQPSPLREIFFAMFSEKATIDFSFS